MKKNKDANLTFECCDLQATTAVLYPQVVNDTDPEFVQVELCGQLTKGELSLTTGLQPSIPLMLHFTQPLIKTSC